MSGWLLVLANLIPLAGALWWNWSVLEIVGLYWLENIIIGLFNALRIACVRSGQKIAAETAEKFFVVPFFLVHYGGFTLVHGIFIFALLGKDEGVSGVREGGEAVIGDMRWALLALALSHGFSFFWNYLKRGEFRQATVKGQMFAPYARVVVLHIAILAGAFAIQAVGQTMALLVILVVGKTIIDLSLHLASHRSKQGTSDPSPNP